VVSDTTNRLCYYLRNLTVVKHNSLLYKYETDIAFFNQNYTTNFNMMSIAHLADYWQTKEPKKKNQ
jgi:hypothetical protein